MAPPSSAEIREGDYTKAIYSLVSHINFIEVMYTCTNNNVFNYLIDQRAAI